MAYSYKPKTRLDKLEYSPNENPLLTGFTIATKKKTLVKTQIQSPDLQTGEIHSSNIFVQKELDEAQFVKIFTEGIKASFDLTRTAYRVFNAILGEYERSPMTGGYVDSIYLAYFDGGLCGQKIGMTEQTYSKGFRELLDKGFLSPKSPNTFWVNPSLFFKGDRVRFINEYVRKEKTRNNELGKAVKKSLEDNDNGLACGRGRKVTLSI